jgi:hypothetical protein
MENYVDILSGAFIELWASSVLFLPKFLLAVVVFLVGLLIAWVLRVAIERIVDMLKIDEILERTDVTPAFRRVGINLNIKLFLGWIVKWAVIILALIAAADALQWDQITVFLSQVVTYLPNVIIAVVILLVGFLLGNFVQSIIKSAVKAAKMHNATFLAGIAKWSVIVFSFMAALVQLGIAQSLIEVLFTGFVAMLALAGGLAFGLGGREQASRILDHIYRDLTSRK